jgi:iron complex outermembrane receptor protein
MVNKTRASAITRSDDSLLSARRTALSLAVAAALPGAMMLPSVAVAQSDDNVIEEVVTTGYRSSLRNAMLMKQESDSIIEAVTAEDIGKLPDASIAEALGRLPGLTVQRLNGRGQQLSVRGLGPDFTTALLNGREQVTTGDNRGVEFDQYPSELLQSVVVYKTPDASLIGAGLAGTADMRTIRPLQYGKRALAGNVRYEWTEYDSLNAGSADDGVRYSLSYVDQFADDTFGVAIGLAHMTNPGQEERFNSWGYPTDPGAAVIGGAKPYVRSSELERTGVIGALEWAPTDSLTTSLDIYYSEFSEEQQLRGIELPLFWSAAQLQPGYTEDNGLITEGQFNEVKGVMRNDITARDSELFAAGLNFNFDLGEKWVADVDLSTSRVDRDDIILETYSGTGPSGCAQPTCDLDEMGFAMFDGGTVFASSVDYTADSIVLTSPQGWGGDIVPGGQVGYDNRPTIEDELNQINLSLSRDLDSAISSVEFGVNFARRDKDTIRNEFFLGLADDPSCTFDVDGNCVARPINSIGTTDLSFLGIPGMVSYDPLAEIAAGTYTRNANPNADVAIKSFTVEEDVNLAYVQFGLDTEIGSIPVQGNFGLQVMDVDQYSSALAASGTGASTALVPTEGGTNWTEVLPSFNLTFALANDNYIRFSGYRTVARARMDQMRASFTYNYDETRETGTTPLDGPWSGSGGNPEVKPWVANAVDLGWEKYFADGIGYFSLAVFYKDIEEFIIELPQVRDFTGFPVPPGQNPGTFEGFVTAPVNGEGGELSGVEVTLSLTGDIISEALTNFGINGNYSYTDSSIEPVPGVEIAIPGLSEEVANFTAYYENDTFGARVSARYRSDFLGEVGGFGGGRFFKDIKAETVIDAQLNYNFSGRMEGLSLLLQGFNLTDEPLTTFAGDDRLILDYQSYGRSYMVGVSYRYE